MQITLAAPSVQSLFIQMRFNGQPLSTGTAFVCNTTKGAVLLTNRHNVTGRHQESGELLSKTGAIPNEILIVHNQLNKPGQWTQKVERILDDSTPLWIEHPTLGAKADFIALPLKELQDVHLYPYDPINPGNLQVGPADVVSVVGFPFGLQAGGSLAVWATGFMASEPDINFNNQPIFLVDCRSRQGQSGSPVIAHRSGGMVAFTNGSIAGGTGTHTRFLGIYSGRINSESDLGIVWKASAIAELLTSI